MSTILNFGRDAQGYNAYAPVPSKDDFSATLTSGGNSSFTVPSNFENWIVTFSYGGAPDIWVAYGATATAPAGATFASTTSELNPGSRKLLAGTIVNVLNNGANPIDVGISCYAVS